MPDRSLFVALCVPCVLVMTVTGATRCVAAEPAQPAAAASGGAAPKVVRLWQGAAPGAKGEADADVPTLTIYPPPAGKNNGAAIVICPGGGYGGLAAHEGKPVADWLNAHGGTGFVLKYRLGPKYNHPVMLNDVGRAIRTVRARATEWGVDPARIGVLGFSAGGHLASTAATHFEGGSAEASDPIDKVSSRPDVAILIYPVITMGDPVAHKGSRRNLLGENPDPRLVELLSNEKQVTDKTPPTYLVHSSDDRGVPIENSLLFASALAKNRVPFAMRVFEHGGHGYGMGTKDKELGTWPESCAQWLTHRGFLKEMQNAE
jgi:acetyl esterase/lipase